MKRFVAPLGIVRVMQGFVLDTYDPGMAIENAWLSMAAYCGHPTLPDGQALRAWECGPACDAVPGVLDVRTIRSEEWDDSFVFLAKKTDKCVVSFRGTSNILGWIADATSLHQVDMNEWGVECHYEGLPCMAGHGFMKNYQHIQDELLGNLTDLGCQNMPLSVTGHSLGAALGYVAMVDLASKGFQVTESYTFGSPRVGDTVFKNAFQQKFENATVYRVTNCKDPVPHLPTSWRFAHVGTEVYYQCDDPTTFHVCSDSGEGCSRQWGLSTVVSDCKSDIDECDHSTYFKHHLHMNLGGGNCHDAKATCRGRGRLSRLAKRCMFPFEYRNRTYDDCTDAFWTVPWCYTDAEGHWGECDCPLVLI